MQSISFFTRDAMYHIPGKHIIINYIFCIYMIFAIGLLYQREI